MLDFHQLANLSFARRACVIRVPFGLMETIFSTLNKMIISGRQAVTMGLSGMAGMSWRNILMVKMYTMQKAICIGLVIK